MINKSRYLTQAIKEDALAKRKMAFISGPRQVGKSTLAKALLKSDQNYYLYDEDDFRKNWTKSPLASISSRGPGPIILDEIHKDRKWKTRLKGIFDSTSGDIPMLVTGSARLDAYRRGSDSLLGRYFPYRLHPFSVAETVRPPAPDEILSKTFQCYEWSSLLTLGGFPEPLFSGSEREALRWSRLRLDRIVLEDTRDLLTISDIQAFRSLISLLPERVGSLLSVNSLRETIQKAHGTTKSWLQVLDMLYYSFTIKPYVHKISRSIRSEPKLYLYDILRIPSELQSNRLENLSALHLLKMCHYWTDLAYGEFELHFLRNKDGREVDFLVSNHQKPWMLVECKTSEKEPSKDLMHYTRSLKPTWSVQLVQAKNHDRVYAQENIRVMDYGRFFSGLI